MRSTALCYTVMLVAAIGSVAHSVRAQETTPVRDTLRAAACEGAQVTDVEFAAKPPPMLGESVPGWLRSFLRTVIQHRPTTRQAVEPFLLLGAGDECTVERLNESERMLRAQRYLADASITASRDSAGGVRLLVETEDEIPLIIGGSLHDDRISSVTYGNGNLGGRGMAARVRWDNGFAYRDGFGTQFTHYHLVGRSTAQLTAVRGSLEEHYGIALTRAYLTDVQHTAWHVGAERREGYVSYLRDGDRAISLGIDRELVGAGAMLRVGPDRRRLMAGVVGSHERVMPDSRGIVIADTGFAADPDTVLTDRFGSWNDTRIGAVLSGRWVGFRTMVGLDSAAGRQDVATGVQFAITAGHGVAGDRRDPFAAFDLYAATAIGQSLLAIHAITEGRQRSRGDLADVVVGGQLAWYRKPSPRRIRMVRAEYSGAWDMSLPMQLALSDRFGGVRGYRGADEAGSRRVVLRLEERLSLGGLWRVAGVGVAGFADIGKLWAGDVPFGTSTGLRPSIGLGFLASVPRRSQRVIRLDVAVPLVRNDPTRSWSVRVATSLPYEAFWREPSDLRRMRAGRAASDLLVWR